MAGRDHPVRALWGYGRYGRLATHEAMSTGKRNKDEQTPFPTMVGKAASHCGAGCTLGDIAAEWLTREMLHLHQTVQLYDAQHKPRRRGAPRQGSTNPPENARRERS